MVHHIIHVHKIKSKGQIKNLFNWLPSSAQVDMMTAKHHRDINTFMDTITQLLRTVISNLSSIVILIL